MSYSFGVRAKTKAEVEILVRDELVKVVTNQPTHKHDCDQAQAAAEAFIRCLADDPTREIICNVSGSLGWELKDGVEVFTSANVNVQAYLTL